MAHAYLIETYATERLKILSVWSMFRDEDLGWRPPDAQRRGRSVLEQMVHQCQSEDGWFKKMLGIDVAAQALPVREDRISFLNTYAEHSSARLDRLHSMPDEWWDGETSFFEVKRSRSWVLVRRMLHSSHHRGQMTAYLRSLGRDLHSTYGPTADTGGLPVDGAKVLYAYDDADALLEGEAAGGAKHPLSGLPEDRSCTERPR